MRSPVRVLFLAAVIVAASLLAGAALPASDPAEPQPADGAPAPPGCPREVDVVFWGGAQGLELGKALADHTSPCVEASISIPALGVRTNLGQRASFDEIRALGIHPVAEIRWTSTSGWRAWVVGGHPQWAPGRTFYGAGVEARRRMAQRGADVTAGETWAFNELTTEVLEGAPGARTEVLEFLRGLYDGAPGMPKARGIVFNLFVSSTSNADEVAAYKASLRSWLTDEAFWTELDQYVDVFANEVYASAFSWGVEGVSLANRVRRLNDYFQHMAVLADDAPKGLDAARTFLRRTYLPLANAAWPHPSIGDTDGLSKELMSQFVSTQVYALLHYLDANPQSAPHGGIGFGWAPVELPGYSDEGRDMIAARLAAALQAATLPGPSSPKDACGPPDNRTWCHGDVPGGELNKAWRTFADWD
jgi:hypothetical protein